MRRYIQYDTLFRTKVIGMVILICFMTLLWIVPQGDAYVKGWEIPFDHILEQAEKGNPEMQFLAGWGYDYGRPGVIIDYQKASSWYEKSASQGNPNAKAMLGYLYWNGQGIKWDKGKALSLWTDALPGLKKRVKEENVYSMLILSYLLEHGEVMSRDYEKAAFLTQKVASKGEPEAMRTNGCFYQAGLGIAQDYDDAMRWYKKAAELGNSSAMYNIGYLYQEGLGVNQDYAEATRWYKKAAELGNGYAMNIIGHFYKGGLGVTQDYVEAMRWYQKAAELGKPTAMYDIGYMYQEGLGMNRDYDEAMRWYQKSAELGNSNAINSIASMYRAGLGVTQDYAEAMRWYKKAGELGDSNAMVWIGILYQEGGHGLEQDYSLAMKWYQKSAELRNSNSMYAIGYMYQEGLGVNQDYAEAMKWYKKAVELGNASAMSNIGDLYREGKGVDRNIPEARKWYQKAAQAGSEYAKKELEKEHLQDTKVIAQPKKEQPKKKQPKKNHYAQDLSNITTVGGFKVIQYVPVMYKYPEGSAEMNTALSLITGGSNTWIAECTVQVGKSSNGDFFPLLVFTTPDRSKELGGFVGSFEYYKSLLAVNAGMVKNISNKETLGHGILLSYKIWKEEDQLWSFVIFENQGANYCSECEFSCTPKGVEMLLSALDEDTLAVAAAIM